MCDHIKTCSDCCTEIQAERAAVLRLANDAVWEDWGGPIGDLSSVYVTAEISDRILRLISTTDRLALDRYVEEAEHKGWLDCLRNVQGSIEGYPNHGGDIEIMKGIERIVEEKVRDGRLAEHLESCPTCIEFRGEAADYDCPRLDKLRAVPAAPPKEIK